MGTQAFKESNKFEPSSIKKRVQINEKQLDYTSKASENFSP